MTRRDASRNRHFLAGYATATLVTVFIFWVLDTVAARAEECSPTDYTPCRTDVGVPGTPPPLFTPTPPPGLPATGVDVTLAAGLAIIALLAIVIGCSFIVAIEFRRNRRGR